MFRNIHRNYTKTFPHIKNQAHIMTQYIRIQHIQKDIYIVTMMTFGVVCVSML